MAKSEETIFNLPQYRDRRVVLRKNPTEPEKRFWQAVRGKQLGVKLRRQHGIGHYIVDFYCPEWALVVELDGDSHFNADAQANDVKRDAYLRGLGLRVLRFTNLEIMQNLDGVLLRVMESNPTPALPLSGEGVKASAKEMENRDRANSSSCEGKRLEGDNSSPCQGGGREGVAQSNTEVGDARINPTPTLPLSGEGVKASAKEMENRDGANSSSCEGKRLEGDNSSPCEGGGREGVAQSNTEVGDARANPTPALPLSGEGANSSHCQAENRKQPTTFPREGQEREGLNSSPCKGGGREQCR